MAHRVFCEDLAYSWEEANGFPAEIRQALDDPAVGPLNGAVPLLIIPELKVPLPGGSTQSQNDAFVLAGTSSGLVSITVEGKVEEPFGQLVSEWGPNSTPGRRRRLEYIADILALQEAKLDDVYYQLLHRTASAVIEAKRFHAGSALMLAHSFSQDHLWFS